MKQSKEDMLAWLQHHYAEHYAPQNLPENCGTLSAAYTMKCTGDRYVWFPEMKCGYAESYDYVSIFSVEELTTQALERMRDYAVEAGLSQVEPDSHHSFSFITVLILCDTCNEKAAKQLKKTKFHRKYQKPQHGSVELRIAAVELSTGKEHANSFGKDVLQSLRNR